jgi:hypothetical protein
LNYSDHCAEQNLPEPEEPLIFSKGPNAIIGPNDDIIIPNIGKDVDLEAEMAIIIGKNGKNIAKGNHLKIFSRGRGHKSSRLVHFFRAIFEKKCGNLFFYFYLQ